MEDYKLCYVESNWAYFTTQSLEKQWGDDWDDAPYEHNAGPPYDWGEHYKDRESWDILKVAWEGPFELPFEGYYNSPWCVRDINAGGVAWLRSSKWVKAPVFIHAGVSLQRFCHDVESAGGSVYMKIPKNETFVIKKETSVIKKETSVIKKEKDK